MKMKEEKHKKIHENENLQYQHVLGSMIEELENKIRMEMETLYCSKLGTILTENLYEAIPDRKREYKERVQHNVHDQLMEYFGRTNN